MEQFNLDTWLQDKSRKVVTRDGRPVRIVCWDVKQGKQDDDYVPILALIDKGEEIGETSFYYTEDGRFLRNINQKHNADLFFADEEEELTELQKTLEEDCDCYVNLYNDGKTREELREWIKCWCHRIIDLARKEIESKTDKNFEDAVPSCKNIYNAIKEEQEKKSFHDDFEKASYAQGMIDGSVWQKQQMMKDAQLGVIEERADGLLGWNTVYGTDKDYRNYLLSHFKNGDRVKIIIVKEEQQ